VSCSNDNKAGQTELSDGIESLLLVLGCSELVSPTADIVVASKVDVVLEVVLRDDFEVVLQESIDSIDEAIEAYILALALVSEKAVNDIVASWGLPAHEDDSDLLWLDLLFFL